MSDGWPTLDDVRYVSAAAAHGPIQDEVYRVCNAAQWAVELCGMKKPEEVFQKLACKCPVCWIQKYGLEKIDGRSLIILREQLQSQQVYLTWYSQQLVEAGEAPEKPVDHEGRSLQEWINLITKELETR